MSLDLYQILSDKSRMEKVLDFLPYPFLISEMQDGVYQNIYVNRRFDEEIGFSLSEIPDINAWFEKAYPDPLYRHGVISGWYARQEEAKRRGEDSTLMRVMITTRVSGEQWYEVKSSASGPLQLVAFVCITDVISKERELERLNETKNRTLSILAHDVRGPLMNLQAMTQMIMDSNISSEEFIAKVGRVNEKSAEVLGFIDTTLLWTKANFNSIRVNPEEVNVKSAALRVIKIYESAFQAKQIEVTVALPDQSHAMDRDIFTIVFRNIFSNAIKFTPAKGSIHIDGKIKGNTLIVSVKDSGVGMTPEMIDRIHLETYQSTPGTHEEKGIGLGLKLCRHLIRKVNGSLDILSKHRAGTEVRVTFN